MRCSYHLIHPPRLFFSSSLHFSYLTCQRRSATVMKIKDMSAKQSNTPIHGIQNDTASIISVTSENDDDRIHDDEHMTTVTDTSTTPRWKWYLVCFGLQLILVSSALEL